MMNPAEVKNLKDWATLPLLISLILFLSRDMILTPVQDQLRSNLQSFSQAHQRARSMLRDQNRFLGLSKRMEVVSKAMERLDRWIPDEDYIPTVIDQMADLAGMFRVDFLSAGYQFENSRFVDHPPRIVIQMQLKAEYADICGFIQALECLPSPLVIADLTASQNKSYSLTVMHMVKS